MDLLVAARHDGAFMRFDVEGSWHSGDALKLAYLIKANLARVRKDQVLVDLRRVNTPPEAQGKFLICDRLRRALSPNMRVGLLGGTELIDCDTVPRDLSHCPDIALFGAEMEALEWLQMRRYEDKAPAATAPVRRKNPPALMPRD